MLLIECIDPFGERAKAIRAFYAFTCEKLGVVGGPKINFTERLDTTSFGLYSPSDDIVTVAVEGRHISDVLRTFGHELVHHVQLTDSEQPSDRSVEDLEYEANAVAGMLMRDYNKLHPEMFGLNNSVAVQDALGDSQGDTFPDPTRPTGPIEMAETYLKEDGEGGAPVNSAGSGAIAGLGVGPQGEPGVNNRKKKSPIMAPMVRRKTFKQFKEQMTPEAARKELATKSKARTESEEKARKALLKRIK